MDGAPDSTTRMATHRRFCRRDGQDEEHQHLAADVAEIARERHEVEIDGEQHQLDAHQENDDVPAVQEHARHRNGEQHAR